MAKLREPKLETSKATKALYKNCEFMAATIDLIGKPKIEMTSFQSPFHSLSRAIVYQQLSGKAASTIHGRVMKLFGGASKFTAKKVLSIEDETFRSAGLSGAKTRALKDLADKTSSRQLPGRIRCLEMSNEDLIDQFVQVTGIGPWTVQMFLMFTLGRPDVWPTTDLGIKKGVQRTMKLSELPEPSDLEDIGERWKPHRTVASWYLWRMADLPSEVGF